MVIPCPFIRAVACWRELAFERRSTNMNYSSEKQLPSSGERHRNTPYLLRAWQTAVLKRHREKNRAEGTSVGTQWKAAVFLPSSGGVKVQDLGKNTLAGTRAKQWRENAHYARTHLSPGNA